MRNERVIYVTSLVIMGTSLQAPIRPESEAPSLAKVRKYSLAPKAVGRLPPAHEHDAATKPSARKDLAN